MKTLRPRLASAPPQRGWKPDQHRGNRHQRGYGSTWDQTRERIFERDCGLCQPCLRAGRLTAPAGRERQCDHVISKAEGQALGWSTEQIEADDNLQTICEPCHLEKTARESMKGQA